MAEATFAEIAGVIYTYGEPYDGVSLRHTGHKVQVACRECGPLPATVHHWSSDWLTLCQEARRHALGKRHEVAVSLWSGAIYAPPGDEGKGG